MIIPPSLLSVIPRGGARRGGALKIKRVLSTLENVLTAAKLFYILKTDNFWKANCLKRTLYLYGSRVNGKSVKFSDVDIALDNHGEPVAETIKYKLSELLKKSILPYPADIIDINSVSPVFKAKIEKDFVKIL